MTASSLTEELLARAQAKLEKAERALASHPANQWLQKAVLHARDQEEVIRRALSSSKQLMSDLFLWPKPNKAWSSTSAFRQIPDIGDAE